jgi:hypothetical protein
MGVSDSLADVNRIFGSMVTGCLYPLEYRIPFVVSSMGAFTAAYLCSTASIEDNSTTKEPELLV